VRSAPPWSPCDRVPDLGALLDANHECHLQVGQQREQRYIGEATIGRHADSTAPYLPDNARHRPANHRELIALHAAFEHCCVISAPIDGHGASTHNQRDDQQVLLPFDGPVDGQPDGTMGRELDKRLQEDGISQVPWLQPFVVEQPRQALRRRLLIPKAASQLGLTAGLLVKNGLHKVPDGFALMAMGPGQHLHNIIIETSSRRV